MDLPINEIICGDCLEVMKDWPDNCVDLVLTDPPYGVGIDYLDYQDNLATTTSMVIEFVKLSLVKSRAVVFSGGKSETRFRLFQEFPPRWIICWYKGAQSTNSIIGFNDWEMIFVYGQDLHNYAHDYFFCQPENLGLFGHPCPKPLGWASILIKRLHKYDGIILDPFCGSGTTCVAAKMLGRRYIGIDISPEYCEIARQRLETVDTGVPVKEQRAGQMALFREAGDDR